MYYSTPEVCNRCGDHKHCYIHKVQRLATISPCRSKLTLIVSSVSSYGQWEGSALSLYLDNFLLVRIRTHMQSPRKCKLHIVLSHLKSTSADRCQGSFGLTVCPAHQCKVLCRRWCLLPCRYNGSTTLMGELLLVYRHLLLGSWITVTYRTKNNQPGE